MDARRLRRKNAKALWLAIELSEREGPTCEGVGPPAPMMAWTSPTAPALTMMPLRPPTATWSGTTARATARGMAGEKMMISSALLCFIYVFSMNVHCPAVNFDPFV